jgi:hypothetical protein
MPKFCIVTKYLLYKGDFWGEKNALIHSPYFQEEKYEIARFRQ